MTEDISNQLSNEHRIIAEEPSISKDTMTKAAVMHMNGFKSFKAKHSNDDIHTYVIPSSKCQPAEANEKYYKCLAKRMWGSFDEYINFGFHQFWITNLSMTNWKSSSNCTCPFFFKQHMCKHIIALAANERIFEFPETANPVYLAPKRTAGRIKHAKSALQHQQ